MDFASALANLEKSAQEASRSNNPGDNSRRRQRSPEQPPYDRRRQQQRRPRHSYHYDSRSPPHHSSHQDNHSSSSQQQSPYSHHNPLSGLVRYGYHVAPYRPLLSPPPDDSTTTTRRPKHIALLAISIDDLPYEHIWKAWACGGSSDPNTKVSLVCHAKFPHAVTSPWLQRRLLVETPPVRGRGHLWADPIPLTHTPEWGSVQITCAMMDLVRVALEIGSDNRGNHHNHNNQKDDWQKDVRFSSKRFLVHTADNDDNDNGVLPEHVPPVDKMIFISETCLPVTSLEHCIQALFGTQPEQEQYDVTTTKNAEKPAAVSGDDPKATTKQQPQASEATREEEASSTPDALPAATTKVDAVLVEGKNDADDALNSESKSSNATTTTTTATFNPWETSWVNARNRNTPGTPRNLYERDQFSNIHRMIPHHCRWKADQWLVLSRPHAKAIAAMDQHMRPSTDRRNRRHNDSPLLVWNAFAQINASDEMYFPTCLAILQILTNHSSTSPASEQTQHHQVIRRPVTFTDWSEGMRNPSSYAQGVADFRKIAKVARAKGCLFARKFVPSVDIPGQERVVKGQITVQEWKTVLDELEEAQV